MHDLELGHPLRSTSTRGRLGSHDAVLIRPYGFKCAGHTELVECEHTSWLEELANNTVWFAQARVDDEGSKGSARGGYLIDSGDW